MTEQRPQRPQRGSSARRGSGRTSRNVRTYVLDTSVLLSDPWAPLRFDEHRVVLPLVVVGELEGKRHHPELGWFARESLRLLDELRLRHGRLDQPVPIGSLPGHAQHTVASLVAEARRLPGPHRREVARALRLGLDPQWRERPRRQREFGRQVRNRTEFADHAVDDAARRPRGDDGREFGLQFAALRDQRAVVWRRRGFRAGPTLL